MAFPLDYCPDGYGRLERLRRLYEERPQDRVFAAMQPSSKALEKFARNYKGGYCPRPDLKERLAFWEEFYRERSPVRDDSIPSAYLSEQDQGLYGGIVGGKVQFMAHPEVGWISSMVSPVLDDWSGLEGLSVDRECEMYRYYLEQLELFRAGAQGRFGISHFILIDGLNFVFELFGATRTYLELIDNPEKVRQAMAFAYRLNVGVQRTFFERIPLLEGGTCSNFAGWLPGRVVSESVDPFHMTSVDYFEEWGRANVERILAQFDGGVVHIHGNGRHLLEAVASVRGLLAIYLLDDRGFPSAFSVLEELKGRTGDVPVVVDAEYPEFLKALDEHWLPGGVLYKVGHVPDCDTANRCMDQVRQYRP